MSTYAKIKNLIKRKIPLSKEDLPRRLEDAGERIEIDYTHNISFNKLDIYQKSHYRRYQFAKDFIATGSVCGDFACGTGYGSIILSGKAKRVIGVDLNQRVISVIQKRYKKTKNVEFVSRNLLNLDYLDLFDNIISFETVEHLEEIDILKIFEIYNQSLKDDGKLIFSTPYMQERSENAVKLGFHLTFDINEKKIESWLNRTGFIVEFYKYQNYKTHDIQDDLNEKDFIICCCKKANESKL